MISKNRIENNWTLCGDIVDVNYVWYYVWSKDLRNFLGNLRKYLEVFGNPPSQQNKGILKRSHIKKSRHLVSFIELAAYTKIPHLRWKQEQNSRKNVIWFSYLCLLWNNMIKITCFKDSTLARFQCSKKLVGNEDKAGKYRIFASYRCAHNGW